MSISSAPFQLLHVPVQPGRGCWAPGFVLPVILMKFQTDSTDLIWTQHSKPLERKNTFSGGFHFHSKVFGFVSPPPSSPASPQWVCWLLVINVKKKSGVYFLHRRQEFKVFRATVKHRSYWVELHSSFLPKARPDIVFVSCALQVISLVPVFQWVRPMREDKNKFWVFWGLLSLSFMILRFNFLVWNLEARNLINKAKLKFWYGKEALWALSVAQWKKIHHFAHMNLWQQCI